MDVIAGELVISWMVVGKDEEKIGVGVKKGRDEDTLRVSTEEKGSITNTVVVVGSSIVEVG